MKCTNIFINVINNLKGFMAFLLVVALLPMNLQGALELNITRGTVSPVPIAITPFADSGSDNGWGEKIATVVTDDLKNSGLFAPVDRNAFIQDANSLQAGPRFAEWRLINADSLVVGKVTTEGDKLRVEFRLFDVVSEAQLDGRALSATAKDWRRIAHKIADAIYERITGDKGYFDSKIIYVARMQQGKKRTERLAVIDQDGENHFYMTNGTSLVMTPRYSPNMQSITFLDFASKVPKVYLMNMATRQRILMGNFPGMTFAPQFSPDGNRLVMSFARNGATNLYDLNLTTHKIHQLTTDPIIDTSPSFSPDGLKIAFNSDRSGQPQLYVMDAGGSNVERISFGPGNYRAPVWSPRGDYIAFIKMYKGEFYIGVIRPDGSGERLLTKGYILDSPCWSPNGRLILFSREDRTGAPHLCSIDITGYNERKIKTPDAAVQGSWSPLIP